jgi:hypothetical protein
VSVLDAGALAVGPGPLGGSWLVAARRSYIDAILAAAPLSFTLVPAYLDAQVRWQSGDGRWTALAFGSNDGLHLLHDPTSTDGSSMGVNTADLKSFDYNARFARIGLHYVARAGDTTASVTPWLGIDDMSAIANHRNMNKGFSRTELAAGSRAEVQTRAAGAIWYTGVDARATDYRYTITNTPPPGPSVPPNGNDVTRSGASQALDAGAFVEAEWTFAGGHVAVRPGLRLDYFGLAPAWALDPRLAVIERAEGGIVVSQTLGVYHEPPLVADLDPIYGKRQLASPYAYQAAVAIEAPFADLFVGKVTAYAAEQGALPVDVVTGATPISANGGEQAGGLLAISRELLDAQFGSYSYREYKGFGRAWGIELIARKDTGTLTGWLSYTYARALRTGDPARDPTYYPYVLDQPHMLTIVATRPLGKKWRIGGRLRLASGNPITPVATAYYNATKMQWTAIDGPLLSERLPDFAQLDLRIDRIWRRRWGTIDLYLDVQNVTDSQNVEGVDYSTDYSIRHYTNGLPILPILGVEYRPSP